MRSTLVHRPEDAVAVLQASGIDGSRHETAVICLGRCAEVKSVVTIEGRRARGWLDDLEEVLCDALPGPAAAVGFASCRPHAARQPRAADLPGHAPASPSPEGPGVAAFDWL